MNVTNLTRIWTRLSNFSFQVALHYTTCISTVSHELDVTVHCITRCHKSTFLIWSAMWCVSRMSDLFPIVLHFFFFFFLCLQPFLVIIMMANKKNRTERKCVKFSFQENCCWIGRNALSNFSERSFEKKHKCTFRLQIQWNVSGRQILIWSSFNNRKNENLEKVGHAMKIIVTLLMRYRKRLVCLGFHASKYFLKWKSISRESMLSLLTEN